MHPASILFSSLCTLNDGCSENGHVISLEEQVFRKDSHPDQDEDQTAGDLHPVSENVLKLFAEHNAGKRDQATDDPDDERRNEHRIPEAPKLTPTASASMLVARESAIRGKNRSTSRGASSSDPEIPSLTILPPTTSSRMKAIQGSFAEINPMTEIPATQPSTVMPVWNPPKQRAMMRPL